MAVEKNNRLTQTASVPKIGGYGGMGYGAVWAMGKGEC